MIDHYIIPPDQFQPANAYNEWKSVMRSLEVLPEEVAKASTWEQCDYKNTLKILHAIIRHRSQSQIFLWQYNIWQTAVKGSEAAFEFDEVVEDDVPSCIQYWSFNTDININNIGLEGWNIPAGFVIAGHFLIPSRLVSGRIALQEADPSAFYPAILFQAGPELTEQVNKDAKEGKAYHPKDYVQRLRIEKPISLGSIIPHEHRDTLASIRFLREKIVEPRQQFLARPDRRREEKAGHSIPEIRTVLLRARASDMTSAMTDEQRREYACHFLVSSHWRQPNHRMKEQRPIFVTSYVKGDTEKPFRPPRETIYHVAR